MTVGRARSLRRQMTDAERRLWSRLRNRGLDGTKFRRQVPIGPYIADILCEELSLIVEVDGGQHSESMSDIERTRWLGTLGYRVVRFWNNDVLGNTDGVLESLSREIAALRPHTSPSGEVDASASGASRA